MGLTDLQVKRFAAREKMYEEGDGKGLYLRVLPTGLKTWIFRYVFDGHRRRMVLGRYPAMSLAAAHQAHGQAMADIERGIDPGAVALEAKKARKAAPTCSDLLAEFWELELQHKKSGTETKRLLEKDVTAVWGRRRVKDITRRDIVLLLDDIRKRAPITANRVHGALGRIFNFAAERGIIEDSPCTRIRKPIEHGRDRVLSDAEIRLFWQGLQSVDIYPVTRLALRLILVSGQRPGEVAGMRWAEIHGEWWTIPAERMKNGIDHRVPIVGMIQEILEKAAVFSSGREHVFASSHADMAKPIAVRTMARAVTRHRAEMGIVTPFVPHDLRRTVRTRLAGLGVDDVTAEKVLGHQLQGMLRIYNRYAYDVEKRAALTAWEGMLTRILSMETKTGGKIIQMVRQDGAN